MFTLLKGQYAAEWLPVHTFINNLIQDWHLALKNKKRAMPTLGLTNSGRFEFVVALLCTMISYCTFLKDVILLLGVEMHGVQMWPPDTGQRSELNRKERALLQHFPRTDCFHLVYFVDDFTLIDCNNDVESFSLNTFPFCTLNPQPRQFENAPNICLERKKETENKQNYSLHITSCFVRSMISYFSLSHSIDTFL